MKRTPRSRKFFRENFWESIIKMNTLKIKKQIRVFFCKRILPDDKGQALIEAVVVLPVLILLIWGVVHLHLSAFYSARAEMATRHAAWIQSVKKDSSAASLGAAVLFENGIPNGVSFNFDVKPDAGLIIDLGKTSGGGNEVLSVVGSAFSTLGGWMQTLMKAIPLTQPLSLNAEATLHYSVTSPGLDPFVKTTKAYFANRYKPLYFHNIWNLFKSQAGSGGSNFPPMGGAAGSKKQMEEMIENFEKELEKNKDSLSEEQYQHYQQQVEQWKQWLRLVS